jgi:hypothetical protein
MSRFRRYGYAWITVAFFTLTIIGHWVFGWFAYVQEQRTHEQPVEISEFGIEMGRDTLENWQSEFLQLLWQVGQGGRRPPRRKARFHSPGSRRRARQGTPRGLGQTVSQKIALLSVPRAQRTPGRSQKSETLPRPQH